MTTLKNSVVKNFGYPIFDMHVLESSFHYIMCCKQRLQLDTRYEICILVFIVTSCHEDTCCSLQWSILTILSNYPLRSTSNKRVSALLLTNGLHEWPVFCELPISRTIVVTHIIGYPSFETSHHFFKLGGCLKMPLT